MHIPATCWLFYWILYFGSLHHIILMDITLMCSFFVILTHKPRSFLVLIYKCHHRLRLRILSAGAARHGDDTFRYVSAYPFVAISLLRTSLTDRSWEFTLYIGRFPHHTCVIQLFSNCNNNYIIWYLEFHKMINYTLKRFKVIL